MAATRFYEHDWVERGSVAERGNLPLRPDAWWPWRALASSPPSTPPPPIGFCGLPRLASACPGLHEKKSVS